MKVSPTARQRVRRRNKGFCYWRCVRACWCRSNGGGKNGATKSKEKAGRASGMENVRVVRE